MSEELKSARDFYHLLYDLDPEEAIPLMEARDKLIEEAALRKARLAEADAIEQCAIEAGERSPEGVSSHTMLGDMWNERILKLRTPAPSTSSDSASRLIEEAARRRAGEPWLFAIEQIDNGTWKDGEQCVFGDLVSAQDEVDLLNDAFPEGDDPYRVVPLFRFAISAPGALAGRPNVVGAKPVCFDCSAAGIINCSHFDNCAGKWVYKASAEHDREIERKARLTAWREARELAAQEAAGYSTQFSAREEILVSTDIAAAIRALRPAASTSSDSVDHLSKIEPDEIDLERDVRKPSSGPGRSDE